jgi:ribonuclease E
MNLLNNRRHELAELETAYEAAIVVVPDHDAAYGEIFLEPLRKDEDHDRPRHNEAPERKRDAEDETVVLDGEAPISFHRALPQPQPSGNASGGRREIQRAALDERERLRSLFEAPEPKNKVEQKNKMEPKKQGGAEEKPKPPKKQNAPAGKPKPHKRDISEPPKLTAEVIASLAVPTSQPRKLLMTGTKPSSAEPEQGPTRKLKTRAAAKQKGPGTNKAAAAKTAKPSPAASAAKPKTGQKGASAKAAPVAAKPKRAEAKPKPAPKAREAKASAPAKTATANPASKSRAKK